VEVAGDGGGLGSAGAGVFDGADDVGGAAGGGDADDDVFAGGAAAGDVALADLGRVFVDVGGGGEGLGAAGHDVLDLLRAGGVGGGTLGGVERGDAAAGAGADVDEASAVAQERATVSMTMAISGSAFLTAAAILASSWLMMRAISRRTWCRALRMPARSE
jgi:hypothetical protein